MKQFLRDLFCGIGNSHWELARIMALWAILSYSGAFIYALAFKGSVPDWSSLGMGFAAIMAGAGTMIGIKDIANPANRKGTTTVLGDVQNANVSGDMNVAGDSK